MCDLIELRNIFVYQSVQHDTLRGTHILSIKIQEKLRRRILHFTKRIIYLLFKKKEEEEKQFFVIESDLVVIIIYYYFYYLF